MHETLLDAWTPSSATLAATLKAVLAEAERRMERDLGPRMVHGMDVLGAGVLQAYSVSPHVDLDFGEWSALWVLRAGVGHVMTVADHVPRGYGATTRRPTKAPSRTVALRAGDVVLFNDHRTHWLDPASDGGVLLALSVDFGLRPGRAQVEEALEAKVRGMGVAAP